MAHSEPSVLYVVPRTEVALALAETDSRFVKGKKVYRKQLIYCDDFEKITPTQHIEFTVTKPLLHHWKNKQDLFKSEGISIPMTLSHIEDELELVKTENSHGELLDTEIAKDSQGRDSIYGFIACENEKLLENDVSIYVPGEYEDKKKNKHYRPIRHICFTKDPVVKGLEKFQAIAASLSDDSLKKDLNSMAKIEGKQIAKLLNVNPDLNDAALESAIENAIAELLKKAEKAKEPTEPKDEEKPLAAAYVKIAKDSRSIKMDELVNKGSITPAVKAEFEKIFIDDKKLSLSLSLSADGKEVTEKDSFSEVIKALSINDPVKLREQTKAQTIALANSGNSGTPAIDDNPVVKDAKRRKEESKK